MLSRDSLYAIFTALIAIFGGSVGSIMALGLLTRRVNSKGVLYGAIISLVGTTISVFLLDLHPTLHAAIAFTLGSSGGLIASALLPATPRNLHGLTVYSLRPDE